ncbi:MAG: fibronectin type III domain-containing protein [Chitinophagaceae bacterium]
MPAVPVISVPTTNPEIYQCGVLYNVSLAQLNASVAIQYGTSPTLAPLTSTRSFGNQNASTTFNYAHTLPNLFPNTTYYYQIKVTESNNTITNSPIRSFTTPVASSSTGATFLSTIRDTNLLATSAVIRFRLLSNVPGNVQIIYRPSTSSITQNSAVTNFSANSNPVNLEIPLTNLTP